MKCAWTLWLWMCMGVFAHAQNTAWDTMWKDAELPRGWKYGIIDKANVRDRFGIGDEYLLGNIVFVKSRTLQVTYYAYYAPDTADARKMINKHRHNPVNQACGKNNIPPEKSEFAAKAQGYTSYLQVGDVLYLVAGCYKARCPNRYKIEAFNRALLEFMFRAKE